MKDRSQHRDGILSVITAVRDAKYFKGVILMKRKTVMALMAMFFIFSTIYCGGGSSVRQDASQPGNDMIGEATGIATIFDNDRALARDRAIDDAMNKLVKSKLGTTVTGREVVQDFALVESLVEASSTGMVKNWTVLKEYPQDNAYFTTIRGEVFPAAVNEAIEATLRNYGRPKFMVLIQETFEGTRNQPGNTVAELTMMEIMGNHGFEFVDSQMTQELMRKERNLMGKAVDGKVGADVQSLLLDDLGAEVIIIGTAQTSDQSGALSGVSRNMKSKQANIRLRAIDVYTGRILASSAQNAPAVHIDAETASKDAIQRCLRKMLGRLDEDTNQFESGPFLNQITKKFLESATRRMITITVAGLNFADMTKFREQLQGRIRGVGKVYPRGQTGTAAKLEIEFAGKTHDFAQELNSKASSIGFGIEILEQKPNRLSIKAVRNQ